MQILNTDWFDFIKDIRAFDEWKNNYRLSIQCLFQYIIHTRFLLYNKKLMYWKLNFTRMFIMIITYVIGYQINIFAIFNRYFRMKYNGFQGWFYNEQKSKCTKIWCGFYSERSWYLKSVTLIAVKLLCLEIIQMNELSFNGIQIK